MTDSADTRAPTGIDGAAPAPAGAGWAIQSHGFLVGVDPASTVIEVASANLATFTGVAACDAVGRTLSDVVGPANARQLIGDEAVAGVALVPFQVIRLPPAHPRSELGAPSIGAAVSEAVSRPGRSGTSRRVRWVPFEVATHRCGGLLVFEFEPAPAPPVGLRSLYDSFHRTLDHTRRGDGIPERCAAVAAEVRALTGYDRVLVCRLDRDDLHTVLADAHASEMESLRDGTAAGAVTPSDRDRYLHHRLRLVVDVEDDPVGLIWKSEPPAAAPPGSTETGPALVLQTEPPTGREHLRGLHVAATLTVPLVVDGRLWGLLACHHRTPRRVPHDVRAACDMLGRLLSTAIGSAQAEEKQHRLTHLGGFVVAVLTSMSLASSLAVGAAQALEALLAMVDADGVILTIDGHRVTAGHLPDEDGMDALLKEVTALADPDEPLWATDAFPAIHRPIGVGAPPAPAGILSLRLGGGQDGRVVWLRNPEPPPGSLSTGHGSGGGRRSRPWLAAELAAAASFATAVPALQLHRTRLDLAEQKLAAAAERHNLEHQLHQNQRLESLGQLAGGIAHDFNNLLAVIGGAAELAAEPVNAEARAAGGDRWAAAKADLDQVQTATARAAHLTRQLLAFARREPMHLRPVDLNTVITALDPLLRRTLGDRVHLTADLTADLPPLLGDPGQLEQVLINLAVNARDAMPGGGRLTLSTTHLDGPSAGQAGADATGGPGLPGGEPAAHPGRVQLRVSDSGTGMAQQVIDRVFEPFFTTKDPGSGTGLGLATVHGIVTQADGTITVTSTPGHGTTFTLVFPALPGEQRPAEVDRPAQSDSPEAGPGALGSGGQTILVVDDRADLRDLTRRVLTAAGYDVLTAPDGPAALTAAASHPRPVDLLLTDVNMPGMTGDELAAHLIGARPGIRVLLMSGYYAPPVDTTGGPPRTHRVLDKPFTRAGLLAATTEVLNAPPAADT